MTWCTLSGSCLALVRLWRVRPVLHRSRRPGAGPGRALAVPAGVAACLAVAGVAALGPAGLLTVLAVPLARRRRAVGRRRAEDEGVRRGVEQLVLLMELALHGGVTLRRAVVDCLPWVDDDVAHLVQDALGRADAGSSLADEFERLAGRFGSIRGLADVVGATERYGAPAGPGLRMLREELRHDQRYRLERAARAVPVRLVFPLVLGVFPAFVLLAVAPMVAGASAGVRLVWS